MENILLVGGCGYIGSNLYQNLTNNGYNVSIIDIANPVNDCIEGTNYFNGVVSDINLLKEVFKLKKIDIVVSLFSRMLPGDNTPNDLNSFNNDLNNNEVLLNVMSENKIIKLVFISSGGTIYGNNGKNINNENDETLPINYYGFIKLTIEKLIKEFCKCNNMKFLIIRPSNAYGYNKNLFSRQGIIPVTFGKIINMEPLDIWGDGNVIRDYIFINDLCYAISSLIKNNIWNDTFNVGSGVGYSINEVLKIIKEITNKSFEIYFKESRKNDIQCNILDISKLKKTIEFDNITALDRGIELFWDYLKANYNVK